MGTQRNTYSNELKLKIVLESMQRDTTLEKVVKQFSVAHSVIHRWRQQFKQHAAKVFDIAREKKGKQTDQPGRSADELTQVIGELTVENQILKKALQSWK